MEAQSRDTQPVAGPGDCPEEGGTPADLGQTRRKTPDSNNNSDITVARSVMSQESCGFFSH